MGEKVERKGECWHVESAESGVGGEKVERRDKFDKLIVANGHYSKPSYGGFGTESEIKAKFQGNVIHSHNYRSPEQSGFLPGQNVVVIGASASALDISVELA